MVKLCYQNAFRALRETYSQHYRPKEDTIRRIVEKLETTGSVIDHPPPTRRRIGRNTKNVESLAKSVRNLERVNSTTYLTTFLISIWYYLMHL